MSDAWTSRRLFVTGATGIVGRWRLSPRPDMSFIGVHPDLDSEMLDFALPRFVELFPC